MPRVRAANNPVSKLASAIIISFLANPVDLIFIHIFISPSLFFRLTRLTLVSPNGLWRTYSIARTESKSPDRDFASVSASRSGQLPSARSPPNREGKLLFNPFPVGTRRADLLPSGYLRVRLTPPTWNGTRSDCRRERCSSICSLRRDNERPEGSIGKSPCSLQPLSFSLFLSLAALDLQLPARSSESYGTTERRHFHALSRHDSTTRLPAEFPRKYGPTPRAEKER